MTKGASVLVPPFAQFTVGDYSFHMCAGLVCYCKDSPACTRHHTWGREPNGTIRCTRCYLVHPEEPSDTLRSTD